MAKQKFDIKQLMSETSIAQSQETRAERKTIIVPLELLDTSPENLYSMDGIEDLAASIEMVGLLQPPLIRKKPDGRYSVIAGHRRRAALRLLVDGGNEEYKNVTCVLVRNDDDVLTELQLLMANSTTRIMTDADKVYQAERIRELLLRLKQSGYKFGMRMRDVVAQMMNVSFTNAGRYESIIKNLSEEWRGKFTNGEINITTAYELSRKGVETQAAMLDKFKVTGKVEYQEKAKEVYETEEEMSDEDITDAVKIFILGRMGERTPRWAFKTIEKAEIMQHIIDENGKSHHGGTVCYSDGSVGFAQCEPKKVMFEKKGEKSTLTWSKIADIAKVVIEREGRDAVEQRNGKTPEEIIAEAEEIRAQKKSEQAAMVSEGMENGIQSAAKVEAQKIDMPVIIHVVKATYDAIEDGKVIYFELYGSNKRMAVRLEVLG